MGNEDKSAEFGRRLRTLREERGLSQHKLAELADLDKNYVTEAERGKSNPSLATLCRLADVLEVDVTDLISETNSEKSDR